MLRAVFPVIAFSCLLTAVPLLQATEHWQCGWEHCAEKHSNLWSLRSRLPEPAGERPPGNGRQYAPDRIIDVTHQKIEFTPDFSSKTLNGTSTITFSPIAKPITELVLDGVDLQIEEVTSELKIESWDYNDEALTILFEEPLAPGVSASVVVRYRAFPQQGLYFRTSDMGYPEGDDHLWTQGEPQLHRHWFPGYDYPNERFTSEVICHVPEDMTVLSNGTLISDTVADGKRTVHWHQQKEHVNYLISVIAGHLEKIDGKHGDLPLAFYTPPSEFAEAANSFEDTAKILSFLESEIGIPFPWAKYFNVCVTDFIAGGMENTSITTLTTRTLFSKSSGNLRTSHRLDAHEITHQWFGDLLTCKDWSHLWLNEGFATFYTHLYEEEKNGHDAMLYSLHLDAEHVFSRNDNKPIVWREYKDPIEQFDYRAYPKGAWVLQMLRSQLGADLYQKSIQTYVERFRNGNVTTADLSKVIEELSGRSFDEFFDQWVYHGGFPNLKANYKWDPKKSKATLNISQTQKLSEQVLLFDFPLTIRFISEEGKIDDRTVRIVEAKEDFSFDLDFKPAIVRIDPELAVLAKIEFRPPNELLKAQAENEKDMIGRLHAVQAYGGKKDKPSIDLLADRLANDSFHGVRIEAARALARTHTDEALAALAPHLKTEDDRVRSDVVAAVSKFFLPEAREALMTVAAEDANPEIVADAIQGLGKYPIEEVSGTLITALERDSYRHSIAVAAIRAMKTQADPAYIAPLSTHLETSKEKFFSRDYGTALQTLAILSREEDTDVRDRVRYLLGSQLNHPNESLRPEIIKAMAMLGDKRAIPVLETVTNTGPADDASAKAAKEAITKLNADKKQAEEVKDLRTKVTDLEKQIRELADKVK